MASTGVTLDSSSGSCWRMRSCSVAKLGTRLEPELLVQAVSQPAVVVERLRLTPGP